MKKKIVSILYVSIFLFVLVSFSSPVPASTEKAPDFTVKDLAGRTVSLSDYHSRVVVLDFWATWCHECVESSQELEKVYKKYKDKGLILLGISLDEGSDAIKKVKAFKDKFNLTYPILMGDQKVARDYFIRGIPTTYVMDEDLIISGKYEGALFRLGEIISSQVEQLLDKSGW